MTRGARVVADKTRVRGMQFKYAAATLKIGWHPEDAEPALGRDSGAPHGSVAAPDTLAVDERVGLSETFQRR
jgi:hypothetical protein